MLKKRHALLESALLGGYPEPVNELPEDKYKISSYVAGTHAEFEKYIEGRCTEISKKAKRLAETDSQLGFVASHIRAFYSKKFSESKESDIATTIACLKKYDAEIVNENHGIKEQHLDKLLTPIGIPLWKVDATLIADLNSYGRQRGGVAHGISDRQLSSLNDKTEKNLANKILGDIESLDRLFTSALKKG